MSRTSIVSIVAVTLVAAGAAYWLRAGERPRVWPKATEPPPASPIYQESKESLPSEEQIERDAQVYTAVLEREIERALLSQSAQDREVAFVFMLPELLQMEPERVVNLVARMSPGEPRNTLRVEVARLWISQDTPAAVRWLKTLDEHDRREAALAAIADLAPVEPGQAREIARELDLSRDMQKRNPLSAAEL